MFCIETSRGWFRALFGVFLHQIPCIDVVCSLFCWQRFSCSRRTLAIRKVDFGNSHSTEFKSAAKLIVRGELCTHLCLCCAITGDILVSYLSRRNRNLFINIYLSLSRFYRFLILSIISDIHLLDLPAAYDATSSVSPSSSTPIYCFYRIPTVRLRALYLVLARTRWTFLCLLAKIVFRFSVRSLFVYLNPKWRRKFIRHAKLFIHWHGTIKHDSLRVVRLVVELAPSSACARRQSSIYTVALVSI